MNNNKRVKKKEKKHHEGNVNIVKENTKKGKK